MQSIAVILGHGFDLTEENGLLSWTLTQESPAMLDAGEKLLQERQVSALFITGNRSIQFRNHPQQPDVTEAFLLKKAFLERGISENKLFLDELAEDTITNALATRQFVLDNGISEVYVVCRDYTRNRVKGLFQMILPAECHVETVETRSAFSDDPEALALHTREQDSLLVQQSNRIEALLPMIFSGELTVRNFHVLDPEAYLHEGSPQTVHAALGINTGRTVAKEC